MNEKKICNHCGAKMIDYTFTFNKGLAAFLLRLYKIGKPCKTADLGLTYAQRTNSQKARYWGLAEPVLNEEGKIKRGWWEITVNGRQFVEGKLRIPRTVTTRRNVVVAASTDDLIGFLDAVDGYEYRKHFQDQASEQIRDASQRKLF